MEASKILSVFNSIGWDRMEWLLSEILDGVETELTREGYTVDEIEKIREAVEGLQSRGSDSNIPDYARKLFNIHASDLQGALDELEEDEDEECDDTCVFNQPADKCYTTYYKSEE